MNIEQVINLIKVLDEVSKSTQLTTEDRYAKIISVYKKLPLTIKRDLHHCISENKLDIEFKKDFEVEGEVIYSPSLEDNDDYDDFCIRICGNITKENKQKLAQAICKLLNE